MFLFILNLNHLTYNFRKKLIILFVQITNSRLLNNYHSKQEDFQ